MEAFVHEAAQRPFQIAAVSAVFWLLLGLAIDYILKVISHPVINATANDVRSRILSTIHAIVIGVAAFYAISASPDIWTDLFGGVSELGDVVCYAFLGYCIYDTFNMIYWLENNGIAMYFHHILSISACFVHYFSSAHMIVGLSALAMMEVTNPSLHILFILRQLGYDGTLLFTFNAALFLFLYCGFRIAGCGYLSYRFYQMYTQLDILWTPHALSFWLFFLLTALSYFWFYKILLMFRRAMDRYLDPKKGASGKDHGNKKDKQKSN